MHIGLGPKPFILATSVFNYADAFDGDLSAWDVSVVIYSARLKSIVYIGWLIVYSGVCTRSVLCQHVLLRVQGVRDSGMRATSIGV